MALRWAVLAHPRARREADGGEMVEAALAGLGGRRGWGAWVWAARVLADLVTSGLRERARLRDEEGGGIMGWRDGWMDLRIAARTLRRTPGFSVAAVLVLALGIGVNTTIFSAVRATLLQPPPYPDYQRIAFLDLTDSSTARPGPPRGFPWSYPKFQAFQDMALPLEASAAYARRNLTLTGAGDAAYLATEFVTPEYLAILGVVPEVGRDFTPHDDADGAGLVTILSHSLWRERFGGDAGVVGRSVVLNGRSVRVVGITPSGFRGLTGKASLWVPVRTGATLTAPFLIRGAQAHWLRALARMEPGTEVAALNDRMRAVGAAVEEAFPDTDPAVVRGGSAESFGDALVNPQARTSLLILAAAGALLLLVACANLAGLLLARASARSREAAVRVALGAGRWRVARTFLTEALVLAAMGGVAGILVARVGVDVLALLWPDRYAEASWNIRAPGVDTVGLDLWVVGFAAVTALCTGLLFGLLPAFVVGQARPGERLRAGFESPRKRTLDLRSALVVGEMGLALVLLVGAGLLLRSLGALQEVDRGFDSEGLVAFDYSLPLGSRWADDPASFHERYLERLRGLPGVEVAALGCVPPLSGHCMITGVREAGGREWSEGSRPAIGVHFVSDDFFQALGVSVVQGRTFTSQDQRGSAPVVVLSQAAVDELFPDGNALGQSIAMGIGLTPRDGGTAEVVGVVGDVLFDRPANGIMPEAFVSYRQDEGAGTVFLKTRGEPLAAIPAARAALAELDPDVPLFNARTVAELEARASGDTRVLGLLLSGFAVLALLLACTGVWAVVSYAVARRTREIGVRVALGADSGRVVRTVLKQGVVLSVVGMALGAGGAWAGSRVLRSLLFGVEPADPMAFVGAALLLMLVSTAASWLPARRATRVDPMVALRTE